MERISPCGDEVFLSTRTVIGELHDIIAEGGREHIGNGGHQSRVRLLLVRQNHNCAQTRLGAPESQLCANKSLCQFDFFCCIGMKV